eukprot:gene714-biopygen13708
MPPHAVWSPQGPGRKAGRAGWSAPLCRPPLSEGGAPTELYIPLTHIAIVWSPLRPVGWGTPSAGSPRAIPSSPSP